MELLLRSRMQSGRYFKDGDREFLYPASVVFERFQISNGQMAIGTEIGIFEVVSKTFCRSAFHQLFVLRRAAGGMY